MSAIFARVAQALVDVDIAEFCLLVTGRAYAQVVADRDRLVGI